MIFSALGLYNVVGFDKAHNPKHFDYIGTVELFDSEYGIYQNKETREYFKRNTSITTFDVTRLSTDEFKEYLKARRF